MADEPTGEGKAAQADLPGPTDGSGAGGVTPKPQEFFVGGRWLTGEQVADENARLTQEAAVQEARMQALRETPVAPATVAAPNEPAWASALREGGEVNEADITRMVADDKASRTAEVQGIVRSELASLSQQVQQVNSAQVAAKAKYAAHNAEFNDGQMDNYLASDSVAKEAFDALLAQGQHYQAYDYAWSKRLLAGKPVNERGRSHAEVPPSRGMVRQREAATGTGASKPKVSDEAREAVAYKADDAAKIEYMRQFRKGTAIDLEAESPVDLNRHGV